MSGANFTTDNYTDSYSGMAPKANLFFQAMEMECDNGSVCTVGDFILITPSNLASGMFQPAYDYGARTHTNSWGDGETDNFGLYSTESEDVDTFTWFNKDFTILFAAGNSGSESGTVVAPGTSKNAITVGNSIGNSVISGSSSRGPTRDGRIKPDVVAPGTSIISARSSVAITGLHGNIGTYYEIASGTSMATPITAGIVALVREYLIKNKSFVSPTSSLIKAMLINGAYDITGTVPDMNQGWGMVDLNRTLFESDNFSNQFIEVKTGLSTSEMYEYNFSLATTGDKLKISLVWTDRPGTGNFNDGAELVNNLDLVLVLPDGSEYYGNDFSAPFNDTVDIINNVEGIRINSVNKGKYKLKITGTNIPLGPQPFSFVISSGKLVEEVILNFSEYLDYKVLDDDLVIFNLSSDIAGNSAQISFDNGVTNYTMNMVNSNFFNFSYEFNTSGEFSAIVYFNESILDSIVISNKIYFNISEPKINFVTPVFNSVLNQFDKQVDFSLNFSKSISNIYYSNGSEFVDLSSSLNAGWLNISLIMQEFGNQSVFFNLTDIYGIKSSNMINFTLNLMPQLILNNPLNNSNVNISKLNIPINLSFNKNISTLNYYIDGHLVNITKDINNSNEYNIYNIDILNYSNKNILFNYSDYFGMSNSFELYLNLTLNLGGNGIDFDNDGILDSNDTIVGNSSNVLTSFSSLEISVNLSSNLSKIFEKVLIVSFKNNSETIVEFEHNFSQSTIDLTKIIIKSEVKNNKSKMFLNGLVLGSSHTKTLYLKLSGNFSKSSSLCLKDVEVFSNDDITELCNGLNETFINSIPTTLNGYSVDFTDLTNSTIKISGLKHSGVSQMCTENWDYPSSWSSCSSSSQSKVPVDLNLCGTSFTKPVTLTQSCSSISSGGGSSSSGSNYIKKIEGNSLIIDDNSKFSFIINSSNDGSKKYNSKNIVEVFDKDVKLISFDYNFENSDLDLSSVKIEYDFSSKSEIILKGFSSLGLTKTVYIKNNLNLNKVCVKDMEIDSIDEITENCLGDNEYLIECDNSVSGGFSCTLDGLEYVVSGLTNTALIEVDSFMIESNIYTLSLIEEQKNNNNTKINEFELLQEDEIRDGIFLDNEVILENELLVDEDSEYLVYVLAVLIFVSFIIIITRIIIVRHKTQFNKK